MELNKLMFREYDIRGVYGKDIDEEVSYLIGKAFGSKLKEFGLNKTIVGYDNRKSSPIIEKNVVKVITECGVDVVRLGLVTTPMYYYGWDLLNIKCGMMITASHNPKDDNGFKFAFDEAGNCKGQEIQDFLEFIKHGVFRKGEGKVSNYNITDEYIELFKNNLEFGDRKLKVVVDPGNGTTSIIVKDIYNLFPMDITYINEESDGRFPNHHPDPCIEDNLKQLKDKVLEIGADIGVSFDGDGDRMGLVSSTGVFYPTDKYMIMIIRDIINKVDKKEFLCDVKCSKCLSDEIEKLGGKCITYRTGNSYTKAAVRDMDLPFGGELSGHVYFRDRWPGFDSGLYAGLRVLEILSKTEKSVDQLLEGINNYYSTDEIKYKSPDDVKFEVVNKILEYAKSKNYKYLDIDGVKVLFDDGWALVRASNTGPNLTVRFEASSEERLKEIQNEFVNKVEEFNK